MVRLRFLSTGVLCWLILFTFSGCQPTSSPDANNSTASPTLPTSNSTSPLFVDVSKPVGLKFRHDAGIDGSYYLPEHLASGAAFLDYDNDGDLDVYMINGANHSNQPGRSPINRLFRNDDGQLVDVTDQSGLGDPGYGMGVAAGDYDNDGNVDLYITNFGPDKLYRNLGDGTFADVSTAAGVENPAWGCSASFVDYDLDGFLDIYVGNYLHYAKPKDCKDVTGRPDYCDPSTFPGDADVLLHNNGDGTFTDVSEASQIGSAVGRGLGVICDDFNEDGLPDIYVANDGEPNFLWINEGDGTFAESAMLTGVAVNRFGAAEASMGVTLGDIDSDGDQDLFVTHWLQETNTLYRCLGPLNFEDATAASGLGAPSLKYTAFGVAFLDFDHDTSLDVALVNGRVRRGDILEGADRESPVAAYSEPNQLFRNRGDGKFEDISNQGGDFTKTVAMSRAMAVGDFDNDGDLDLLVSNCHAHAQLFRNDVPKQGNWLMIRAVDPALKRDAYGARVTLWIGSKKLQRTVNPGYSYAASNDPRVHFGVGAAERVDKIEIRWPGGVVQEYDGVKVNQHLVLFKSPSSDAER